MSLMMRIVNVFLLSAGLVGAIFGQNPPNPWPNEPDSFLGVNILASEQEAKQAMNFNQCGFDPKAMTPEEKQRIPPNEWFDQHVRFCTANIEAGAFNLTARFRFVEDQLRQVNGTFEPERYEDVKKLFIEKYGPPANTKQNELQGPNGQRWIQESLQWKGRRLALSLANFSLKGNEGSFALVTVENPR